MATRPNKIPPLSTHSGVSKALMTAGTSGWRTVFKAIETSLASGKPEMQLEATKQIREILGQVYSVSSKFFGWFRNQMNKQMTGIC